MKSTNKLTINDGATYSLEDAAASPKIVRFTPNYQSYVIMNPLIFEICTT